MFKITICDLKHLCLYNDEYEEKGNYFCYS